MDEYSALRHSSDRVVEQKDSVWWAASHGNKTDLQWWVENKGKEVLTLEDDGGNTPLM